MPEHDPVEPPDSELRTDAWCGEGAHGRPGPGATKWSVRPPTTFKGVKLAPTPVDAADWRHPAVGWGVVLPDRTDATRPEKARGDDGPEPIRQLLADRGGAPVFRYRPEIGDGKLRYYTVQDTEHDLAFSGDRGGGPFQIPHYLLIVGAPAAIPWSAQLRMQLDACVGRLDLDAAGLDNYVRALRRDWSDSRRDATRPLIWAVDHGHPDITRLMRKAIADKVAAALTQDGEFDMRGGVLMDGDATGAGLVETLRARTPAFVLTSSHGATFPLHDTAAMTSQLGLPVDHAKTVLPAERVPADAAYGAIWYAHACCSAGSDGASQFTTLVEPGTLLSDTLRAVERCGSLTAPLPRRLLGSETPVRAFVGHVEPTFNWTLRTPDTGQVTTHRIVQALYNQLHRASRPPVGLAMATYYTNVAGLLKDHLQELDGVNKHAKGALERAMRAKLMALDRLATVVLGDPTVTLPRPV